MLTQVVANRTYDFSHCLGGRDMMKPYSLALASGNVVFLVNRLISGLAQVRSGSSANDQLKKIDTGDAPGQEELLLEFGKMGEGEDELYWPSGISCDSEDNVFVADEWLNRISVFDSDGRFVRTWGVAGSGEGQLLGPSGLQFDSNDNLYVVDGRNHRVQKFTREGRFIGGWGGRGSAPGLFDSPWGITIDGEGSVYLADHKNNRVQKFTPEGEFLLEFGGYGSRVGQLNRPTDVAVDPDGDIYVCDWANSRVNAYDDTGKPLTSFIGDAMQLSKWQQQFVDSNEGERLARRRAPSLESEWRFALPTALEFHPQKNWLMVSDYQRGRFQIYAKLQDYNEPQFNL